MSWLFFVCRLVVTCWEKGWPFGCRVCVVFCHFPKCVLSTSESRVRLAPWNWFKPSRKVFYWPFQGGTYFVDLLCFFVLSCVFYVFVRVCLYVLCGHLLGKGWPLGSCLWCLLWVCHFPIGILGQVWYLIVLIPDLCTLTYYGTAFRTTMSEMGNLSVTIARPGSSILRDIIDKLVAVTKNNKGKCRQEQYWYRLLKDKI